MNNLLSMPRPAASLSVAALGLVLLQQSCFEMEMTTRLEPDGSGQFVMDLSASSALLELSQERGGSTQDLQFDQQDIQDMRASTDTIPGLHFDTAYRVRDAERTGIHAAFRFDSVAVLENMIEDREPGDVSLPTLRARGRQIRLRYHPTMSFGSGTAEESPFGQMGREMALKMTDMRFRYIFPQGTSIDTANPAVQRTDSTVVYEWDMRDLVEASEGQDSLYVSAQLPPSGTNWMLWLAVALLAFLVFGTVALWLNRSE